MRPSLDEYFMGVAEAVAARSTCPRLHVGAIVTDGNRIVATGFNGAPMGAPHCDHVGCLIIVVRDPPSEYCANVVHAEVNALLMARGSGDTLYTVYNPCLNCLKAAINAGIKRVVYDKFYNDPARDEFLQRWASLCTKGIPLRVEKLQRRDPE